MKHSWRLPTVGVLFACVLGVLGCLDPHRRVPGPREMETIFSAPDLPTPNRIRTVAGLPGPDYWQQRVDWTIEAELDEATGEIRATGTMTYTNNSPEALDCLWLQLEQNLFKPGSIGSQARPLIGLMGMDDADSDTVAGRKIGATDGIHVEYVKLLDAATGKVTELTLTVYDTIGLVELPVAIAAQGGTVKVEMSWSFKIPAPGSVRMGIDEVADGKTFEVAQWIPTACVYDDVHGWNTLPYLGMGEFYTNFGTFDVKLRVPRDHLVAATGVLQNEEEVLTAEQRERLEQARTSRDTVMIRTADEVNDPDTRPAGDGPLTWHFIASDVRTFAWASSPTFIWDAASIAERGTVPSEAPSSGDGADAAGVKLPPGTLVQSMYPREALPSWSDETKMLRAAIEYYNKTWRAYPYPVATSVNGIEPGMEYPMLIFCGRPDKKDGGEPSGELSDDTEFNQFFVTAHEIGHNWFPMVINTDERRYAWMDEGFNTFLNIYAVRDYVGERRFHEVLDEQRDALLAMLKPLDYQPIDMPPDQMVGLTLGMNAYYKTALGLFALREGVLGHERFDRAFKRYMNGWAFKSPQPADFFRCMSQGAGEDLDWFWRGWFMETGVLDQAVVSVSQPWNHSKVRITFGNRGEMVMPVVYEVRYSDGSTERRTMPVEAWAVTNRRTITFDTGGKRVVAVQIDPDNVFPDVNTSNNRWRSLW